MRGIYTTLHGWVIAKRIARESRVADVVVLKRRIGVQHSNNSSSLRDLCWLNERFSADGRTFTDEGKGFMPRGTVPSRAGPYPLSMFPARRESTFMSMMWSRQLALWNNLLRRLRRHPPHIRAKTGGKRRAAIDAVRISVIIVNSLT